MVRSYLALSKIKEALHAAREAMKAMPQSAKALKLVGDVHASNSSGREKVFQDQFQREFCACEYIFVGTHNMLYYTESLRFVFYVYS